MKTKFIIILSLLLCTVLALGSCFGGGDTTDKVTAINVVEGTMKLEYEVGDTVDFSGVKAVITYESGKAETVTSDKLTISNLDTSAAGKKTVTVKYGDVVTSVQITVKEKAAPEPPAPTLSEIKIVASSIDSKVMVGDIFSLGKLKVEATYSDSTVKVLGRDDVEVSSVDTAKAGKQTLTVTYNGKTDSVDVTVIGVQSIDVTGYDSKIRENDKFDTSEIKASVTFTDGSIKIVNADELTIDTVNSSTPGEKKVEVKYLDGKTDITVTVLALTGITVYIDRSSVKYGDFFSINEITATAVYGDNEDTRSLRNSDLRIVNIDTSVVGVQELEVYYGGFKATVEVLVVGVSDIIVSTGSVKDELLVGDELDVSNIGATVRYTDGTSEILSYDDLTVGSVSTATSGVQQLSVSYLDKTINYPVTVCGVESIRVEGVPAFVLTGGSLDLSDMKVFLVYSDAAKTELEISDDLYTTNIDELDFSTGEENTLVVSYSGEHGEFSKSVVIASEQPPLDSIEIYTYSPIVILGGQYDKSTVKVEAIYTTGITAIIGYESLTFDSDIDTSAAGVKTVYVSYTENGVTKSAQLSVEVLPITDIIASGLASKVDFGTELDVSGVNVTVTYSNGDKTVTATHGVADGVTVSGFDKNVAGDQTVTISYLGASDEVVVHVRSIESIIILSGSYDHVVREGYAPDLSRLEIEITYTDGTKETKKVAALGESATASYASAVISVSYTALGATKSASSVAIETLKIDSVTALNGTTPTSILKGAELDLSKVFLTVIYKAADGTKYLYFVGQEDNNLSITAPNFNKDVAGEYAIQFRFLNNDSYTATVIVTVKEITSLTLVPGSMSTTVDIGDSLNTVDALFRADFSDGSYVYVGTNDGVSFGTVDTSVAGELTLQVTYLDKEIGVPVTVIDTSANVDKDGFIYGVALPDNLTARESYKGKFKIQNEDYVVGDDNPYYFYLNLLMLDANDEIISVDGKSFKSIIKVYLVDGNSERELTGEELLGYVTINAEDNSYDFTEAAIGKSFKLEIRPDSESVADLQSVTRTHTVKIVDAYNIYEAWELNFITNTDNTFESDNGALSQLALVREFLAEKTKKTVSEVADISNSIKGVVLHGNMDIKTNDIPDGYLYEYKNKNGVTKREFYDYIEVFCHAITPSNPTFTIEGNYYTVYSYNLPCVVETGVHKSNSDSFSNSKLICLKGGGAIDANFNHKNYQSYVRNTAFRDNDPNSNDQSASERHMRGVSCFRLSYNVATVYNTNIDAYYVSMVPEADDLTINLDNVKFYNAWQGHLFIWNNNYLQEMIYGEAGKDMEPRANYQNIKINITNSLLAKCGGPVILSQTDNKDKTYNKYSGADVVAVDSELYSYVTGQEAWFVAVGQTAMAGQILGMNQLVSLSSGGKASYLSDQFITGVNTMNMVMVNMGPGTDFTDRGYQGTFTEIKNNPGGESVTINGLNMTSNQSVAMYKAVMEQLIAMGYVDAMPPFFQSSTGGTCFSDGATGCYGMNFSNYQQCAPDPECFKGDYITLYYMGMGIMLEYYTAE